VVLDNPDAARCISDDDAVSCAHVTVPFHYGALTRQVHLQVPNGTPPDVGWPTVFLYQPSFFPADLAWDANADTVFGGLHQAELVRGLLDGGFAVLTPETRLEGLGFWQTNTPPQSIFWFTAEDAFFVGGILDAIDDGTLGPLDPDALFAAGMADGGYMTSRMALSYPGRFRALAIQSGGWATCAGAACVLPVALPADHPPTIFLHGEADPVVPLVTMERYADLLEAAGVDTERVTDPDVGHAWLAAAPTAVVEWFEAHP